MKEIWSFLTPIRWLRNTLRVHSFTPWNETISDLQRNVAHPIRKRDILCITVQSEEYTMYNRTEEG